MDVSFLTKKGGQKLAYVHVPPLKTDHNYPALMFLGGFKSDMTGTKAVFLEERCRQEGREFLRFDYTGHGVSDGKFEDGTIGLWTHDAARLLEKIQRDGVILVGSSMGGWIALNLLLQFPERVRGVVGIAAAPDFTQTIEPRMSAAQKAEMEQNGKILVPSSYGPEPYVYTKELIEDGKRHVLLGREHQISAPMILLQGKRDDAVPWETANKIVSCFRSPHSEIIYIEDGDHRLSRPEDLQILWQAIEKITKSMV